MIEATYVVSETEWQEAQSLWCKPATQTLPGKRVQTWLAIALGGLIGLSLGPLPWPLRVGFILWLLASFLIGRWRPRAVRRHLYKQATDRDQTTQLRIDQDGYRSVRPGFNECRMQWRCFTGWREGQQVFVLGRGIQFCIVPKLALSPEQQAELRVILSKYMNKP